MRSHPQAIVNSQPTPSLPTVIPAALNSRMAGQAGMTNSWRPAASAHCEVFRPLQFAVKTCSRDKRSQVPGASASDLRE